MEEDREETKVGDYEKGEGRREAPNYIYKQMICMGMYTALHFSVRPA